MITQKLWQHEEVSLISAIRLVFGVASSTYSLLILFLFSSYSILMSGFSYSLLLPFLSNDLGHIPHLPPLDGKVIIMCTVQKDLNWFEMPSFMHNNQIIHWITIYLSWTQISERCDDFFLPCRQQHVS
jgi:hypothetical protein